jgi:hypothetical protein
MARREVERRSGCSSSPGNLHYDASRAVLVKGMEMRIWSKSHLIAWLERLGAKSGANLIWSMDAADFLVALFPLLLSRLSTLQVLLNVVRRRVLNRHQLHERDGRLVDVD